MPPRYVYWTILIDGKATAFRARERDELLPTFNQLARKNRDIAMRYFARGKLWDNPEQAEWAAKSLAPPRESRNRDWRPGGAHEDPRARFKKTTGPGKSWSGSPDPAKSRSPRPSGHSRNLSSGGPPSADRPSRSAATGRPTTPPSGAANASAAGPVRKSWSGGKPRKPR